MKIQPKPVPAQSPHASPPANSAKPETAALPKTPKLPPHAFENRTFAEMPDRDSPDWGKPKPQLTVVTDAGELAKIPKHPAQMTEGELMDRYFDPAYKFDTATGKSTEPFFAQTGHLLESPTHVTPPPRAFPAPSALAQPSVGLWGGATLTNEPGAHTPRLEPASTPTPPADPRDAAPLLPHERMTERPSPPQTDRFTGIEGWGRNAGQGARNDYYGSDWD